MRLRIKLKAFLRAQAQVIAAQVVAARERLGKTAEDDVRAIMEALDFEGWAKLIPELKPIMEEIIREAARAGMTQLDLSRDINQMLTIINRYAVSYAGARGSELVTGITEVTRNMIRVDVARAIEEGQSNDALAQAIRENTAFSGERAELIARTESASADVQGNLEAYRMSGVVSGKQWITGAGCCDLCNELDGVTVDLDEDFPNDGGAGPPLHPNCRCDVLPVLGD